jgi:peptide deformylase
MAVREVIRMGHPTLREKARPLSKEEILSKDTKQLVQDLFETMDEYEGIGIAAPQVGVAIQLAIIGIAEENPRYPDQAASKTYIVINPTITVLDETTQGFWEGCLSVPGLRGYVERPRKIRIDFLDMDARLNTIILEGFLSTVFQHELDHLTGTLYVDRIKDKTKLAFNEEYAKFIAQDDDQEID